MSAVESGRSHTDQVNHRPSSDGSEQRKGSDENQERNRNGMRARRDALADVPRDRTHSRMVRSHARDGDGGGGMNRTVILTVEADLAQAYPLNGRQVVSVTCQLGKLSDALSQMVSTRSPCAEKAILAKLLQTHLGGNLETVLHTIKESAEEGTEYPWSPDVVDALVGLVRHMGDVAAMHPEKAHMLEGMAKIRAEAGNALVGRLAG